MRLRSSGPAETSAFGRRLGSLLRKGDVVFLFGDLGSGKTTFVKGIGSSLGIEERDVASASFTIIAEHEGTRQGASLPLYHIDLYRIGHAAELDEIGLEEYLGGDGIAVVEWAERLSSTDWSVMVSFQILDGDAREITIEGISEEDWHNL